ncbi:hypothetical protein ACWCQS_44750 [Streptomyces sp. NPDC002076]
MRVPDGGAVANRGDCIGVLTDLYLGGRRTTAGSLAAEIRRTPPGTP